MKLLVVTKNVYGKETIYPVCDKSKAFLEALGFKTFTHNTIRAAKALGYEFEQVFEKINL